MSVAELMERRNRWTKVWKLVYWCEAEGNDFEDAASWDENGWRQAAEGAGVNLPSEVARGMVIGLLAKPVHEREQG